MAMLDYLSQPRKVMYRGKKKRTPLEVRLANESLTPTTQKAMIL